MPSVGILAYGSLNEEPGPDIEAVLAHRIGDVRTPFNVEFARKSKSRGYGPSLVPVGTGGAQVPAAILVLRDGITMEEGQTLVWRRETRQKAGNGKRYVAPVPPGPDHVVVRELASFHGIDVVLYTSIGANIHPLTAEALARLAVDSVALADPGKDGITYLSAALAREMVTPLSAAYTQEVLKLTSTRTLAEALSKLLKSSI